MELTEAEIEKRANARRRAFFWILGVVLAFVALAVFFTFTSFLLVQRENARRERCDLNLSRIYAAFVEYSDAYGTFPPAFTTNSNGDKLHSWRTLLLPYLGEEELYSQIRLNEPWDSESNRAFWKSTPNVYRCASTPIDENAPENVERCAYSCVVGSKTAFPDDGSCVDPKDIVDGASNTILVVERKAACNWMDPNSEISFDQALAENAASFKERKLFGSWHGAGEFVVFCDGGRKFLSEKLENSVLELLLGIHDSNDDELAPVSTQTEDELPREGREEL